MNNKDFLIMSLENLKKQVEDEKVTSFAICFIDNDRLGHCEIYVDDNQWSLMCEQLMDVVVTMQKKEEIEDANTTDNGANQTLN